MIQSGESVHRSLSFSDVFATSDLMLRFFIMMSGIGEYPLALVVSRSNFIVPRHELMHSSIW